MTLEKTYPTGAEEWACPTCGRRFVMQWPPAFKRIVLERGDEEAQHGGGKAGVQITSVDVSKQDETPMTDALRDALEDVLGGLDL